MKKVLCVGGAPLRILVLLLLLLVLANIFIKDRIDRVKDKTINLNLSVLRNLEKNYISKEFKNNEEKFDHLHKRMKRNAAVKDDIKEILSIWKESDNLLKGISQVYVGLDDGRLIATPEYSMENGYSFKERPWYREVSEDPDEKKWLVYREYHTNEVFLSLNQRIRLRDGSKGVFGIAVDNEQMRKNLDEIIPDKEGSYMFLISSSKVIYHDKKYEKYELYGGIYDKIKDTPLGWLRGRNGWYVFHTDTHLEGWKLVKAFKSEVIEEELDSYQVIVNTIFMLEILIVMYGVICIVRRIKVSQEIDRLTGVFKRDVFQTDLDSLSKEDRGYGIIFMDIDNFKKVNDTYGHQVGDEVLKEVGRVIKGLLGEEDRAYRYGGEEFVICSRREDKEIWKLAEDIRKEVEELELDRGLKVTISGGIKISRGERGEDVVRGADDLLYVSKRQGKNRITI